MPLYEIVYTMNADAMSLALAMAPATATVLSVKLVPSVKQVPDSEPVPEPVELVPAVSVNKSVGKDWIVCLEDGKKFKSLKRHLSTHYGLTPAEYRTKWGLPPDYPMVAPSYAAVRSKLAKANGLGRK